MIFVQKVYFAFVCKFLDKSKLTFILLFDIIYTTILYEVKIVSNLLVKGIMPALVSSFTNDGAILEGSIKANIDRNYGQGAAGFYICGSTGEGPVLTVEQRKAIAECVVEHSNGRGIIVNHVGAASPFDAFELSRHAKACGCDAISSVVPNFYYKYNEDEIVEYYKRIAAESELPVIAYAQSLLTGDPVSLMKKLIEVDGVIGVKYTLTDFYSMRRIKELNGGDINVINGPDEMLICGLSMGADAGIGSTYNLMCGEYCKLFNQFKSGDVDGARATQYKINKVVEILIKYGVIRSIKHVLSLFDIPAGDISFPGTALTAEEKASLEAELKSVGYFDEFNK